MQWKERKFEKCNQAKLQGLLHCPVPLPSSESPETLNASGSGSVMSSMVNSVVTNIYF